MHPFKNREIRIKVAKSNDENTKAAPTADEILRPETIENIENSGKRIAKYVAGVVVAAIVIVKVADTLSQIAVKKTKSADNED